MQAKLAKITDELEQTRTKLQRAIRKGKAIEADRDALKRKLNSLQGANSEPAVDGLQTCWQAL